ncbi:MAG: ribonucleoside triphosphate reductase [Candidatus Cloacimonetes bacterium]|nr:ribonucleoside triphosphate reductase [Candidatus Cloacimonadota bacterium]
MFTKIRKRNGKYVDFELEKITEAIYKAGQATREFDEEIAKKLTFRVLNLAQQILHDEGPSVEEIQDIVEEVLLTSPYKKTAKSYILYRDQHSQMREIVSNARVNMIDDYIDKIDWQVQENSNMSYSLQGLNNYLASEVSKAYWLNKIYPPEIRNAHQEGDFHIHDLGIISVYCVGWDLMDLLLTGFTGVEGKVESKPAKHFRAVLGQLVNFFYTLQGEAAGAQAFSNFDTLLAPFIRYDNLEYKEVKQAMQEFIFNINVPTRVGFQTPFTNISMDLIVPANYADTPVVIGGKQQKETYSDFQYEMDLLNRAFLEVMTEGDAKGRVFTFPIPTYSITKDFNWENENLQQLWAVTAKYGIPYFSNFVNSELKPEDARSMCCRLRLDTRTLTARGGGLFGANPLTGSIGVVTINLPRIGYLSDNEAEFFAYLDTQLERAKKSLEIKRKILEKLTDNGLYPYSKFYLRMIKERFDSYWKNHFSTIGIVGMNEASINLNGENLATETGQNFAVKVMDYIRDRLIEFQEETGNYYNLEATPAESTSYRLARLDKHLYKDIVFANGKAISNIQEPYYTNSTQLPVNYSDDIFEVLDKQDPIQIKYTGGTVLHIYGGEKIDDPNVVKKLVSKICQNYHLPYFTFTPTFSICPNHGYLNGEVAICPQCEAKTEIYSRVTGYLRPVSQWNAGKQEEYKNRVNFKIKKVI